MARDGPGHVHPVLQRLGHSERSVDGDEGADDRRRSVALQTLWVAQLLTDDRELTEGRVEDPALELGIVVEHEAEHRRQQQQQREERQEAVVRDERREVDALIVEELVGDGQWKADHGMSSLEGIDSRDGSHPTIVPDRRAIFMSMLGHPQARRSEA